jgi:hypothetical protein
MDYDLELAQYAKTIEALPHYIDPAEEKAMSAFLLYKLQKAADYEERTYGKPGTPVVDKLSDVEEKAVQWWWEGRFPRGKLTVIDGDPGIGKSWLTCFVVARATVGEALPGETGSRAKSRALFMVEDDAEDTVIPRLRVMGADLDRVYRVRGVIGKQGGLQKITLHDIATLRRIIEVWQPNIVVIDPAIRYMGKLNTNAATEVRAILDPLNDLAKEFDCAIVGIRHLNKDEMKKAMYRGQGSMDFIGAARSAFVVIEHSDKPGLAVFCHTKINNARKAPSLTFCVEDSPDKIGRFVLGEEIPESADDLMNASRNNLPGIARDNKLELAKGFLLGILSDGPRPRTEVSQKATRAGIADRTLERAKSSLKMTSVKRDNQWLWLPPAIQATPTGTDETVGGLAPLEPGLTPVNNAGGGVLDDETEYIEADDPLR